MPLDPSQPIDVLQAPPASPQVGPQDFMSAYYQKTGNPLPPQWFSKGDATSDPDLPPSPTPDPVAARLGSDATFNPAMRKAIAASVIKPTTPSFTMGDDGKIRPTNPQPAPQATSTPTFNVDDMAKYLINQAVSLPPGQSVSNSLSRLTAPIKTSNPSQAASSSAQPSTPTAPNPKPSTEDQKSSNSKPESVLSDGVKEAQNTPLIPVSNTDSAGYPDQPGDVRGVTYQEAKPVGAYTFRDLTPEMQQRVLEQTRGIPNGPELFNQLALAKSQNALMAPNSPELAMQEAFYGMKPETGPVVDMGQFAQARARAMQGMLGGRGAGGSTDPQGIPWEQLQPKVDPKTGDFTMDWQQIPAEARGTAVPGLSQGALNDVTSAVQNFYTQEGPKNFYGEIQPKFNAINRLIDEAKRTGDYNQFRDMDVLNSYAGIARPGAVVRDSTIEMDLEGAGIPTDLARKWSSFVAGQGTLTEKDLNEMQSAAKSSYEGWKAGVEQAKKPLLIRAHLRTGLPADALNRMMFPDDNQPAQAQQPENEELPSVTTQAQFDSLPSGARYIGRDGRQFTKP